MTSPQCATMIDQDESSKDVVMESCSDDVPQLDPASEGDDSSSCESMEAKKQKVRRIDEEKKRVRWSMIHTREFALVVGDHPLCQDGLPVSLDWQYNDSSTDNLKAGSLKISERTKNYRFPRRLSYDERRKRLCQVSGFTEDQVKDEEIDLVVRTLKESWEHVAMDSPTGPTDHIMEPSPLPEGDDAGMVLWDDIINQDIDVDFGDVTDFEWTD